MPANAFLSGVIEGFYGRPWSPVQRRRLLQWLQRAGLNAYLYGPKDDLKHRALWRAPYEPAELAALRELVHDCDVHGVTFIHALAPGLDIRFSEPDERAALLAKLEAVAALGVSTFALLFDDIPAALEGPDAARFGAPAGAQAWLANEVLARLRETVPFPRLLFCPTVYCGRMARPSVAEDPYLRELGEKLAPAIDVFWTGPHIVSETIPLAGLEEVTAVLGRKPVIWDNLHANDYDARRLYLGPYAGRPPELREKAAGILLNPNCQFAANFVPVHTLGSFLRPEALPPAAARERALEAWRAGFDVVLGEPFSTDDLCLLSDLLYLPTEFGEAGRALLADVEVVRTRPPAEWADADARLIRLASRLESLYEKLTRLRDRDLAHDLYAHSWELKELGLFLRDWLAWRRAHPDATEGFSSPDYRPGIFRGSLGAILERRLPTADADDFPAG